MVTKLPFAALQKIEKVGSVLPLAAFAHETNVKPEGEWRQCGQSVLSLRLNQYPLPKSPCQERWFWVRCEEAEMSQRAS
jgi:hypothetical protein